MKKVRLLFLALAGFIVLCAFVYPGDEKQEPAKVKWYSFLEAVELSKKLDKKKKIFIDVYTDWCGPCKMLDRNTFSHPVIAKYLNENFIPVKLNAEMKDTIVYNNFTFLPSPGPRMAHQLAASLLSNKMQYPTIVFLDENFNMITPVAGYRAPHEMEPLVKYIGSDIFRTKTYDNFILAFQGEIPPPPPPPVPYGPNPQ